jgi:hypothetical protein
MDTIDDYADLQRNTAERGEKFPRVSSLGGSAKFIADTSAPEELACRQP